MKKCPYCAEEIQDDALKCRFCNEFLEKRPKYKWYFKTSFIIIAFICVSPLNFLALPLVWFNPRFSRSLKVIISIVIIILSYYLIILSINSIKSINEYYKILLQQF